MDQIGPTQEEDHMGRSMEIAAFRISFLLRSVYDTLPTVCKLCSERGTMAHQGRYRWRHDKVFMTLANTLEQERCKKRQP